MCIRDRHYIAGTWHRVSQLTVPNCFHKDGFGNSEACNNEVSCDVPVDDEEWDKLEALAWFDDYGNIDDDVVTTEAMTILEIAIAFNSKWTKKKLMMTKTKHRPACILVTW